LFDNLFWKGERSLESSQSLVFVDFGPKRDHSQPSQTKLVTNRPFLWYDGARIFYPLSLFCWLQEANTDS